MYLNKFSSGTILALLALSGVLFLVPLAAPAHAVQNASQPVITLSNNLVIGNVPTGEVISVMNPTSNAYVIDSVTVSAPANWNFSSTSTAVTCSAGTAVVSVTAISCPAINIIQGFTGTITITGSGTHAASPEGIQGPIVEAATDTPIEGTFATSIVDGGSSPAAYVGPTFSLWSIFTPGALTFTAPTSTVFVAGSPAVTTTVQIASDEPGVPITLSVSQGAGTLSTTLATTGSSGSASFSFTPTNTAGNPSATISAVVADSPSATAVKQMWQTVAATPSSVSFTIASVAVPATHYIEGPTNAASIGGVLYANQVGGTYSYAISDAYSNSIPPATLTNLAGHFTATNGFWDASTTTVTTGSYSAPSGAIHDQYSQASVYGTVGLITGTFTGDYQPTPTSSITSFSVSGSTGDLFTSTLGTVSEFLITTNGVTVTTTGGAGNYVIPQLELSLDQAGVPVTINLCANVACSGTTVGYTGSFASNGLESVTVDTSATSPSTGNASAHYNVDTTLGTTAIFNATVLAPIDGTPTNTLTAGPSPQITTVAGSPAQFGVFVGLITGPSISSAYAVPGATIYLDIYAADKYGNLSPGSLGEQVGISLSATAGALSTPSAYIPNNCWTTNGTAAFGCNAGYSGFGPISWTLPNTVGAVSSLTVSGVIAGSPTSTTIKVTTVSTLPTLSVTSPAPVKNVIYSPSAAVVFQGQANVSLGYPPYTVPSCESSSCVSISSLAYKVNSGTWTPVTIATDEAQVTWSLAATMPQGLSTIWFNATDSKSNVVVSPAYTVLVDNQPPTFTIGTPAAGSGSDTVTIQTAEGDFNTSSFAATWGTTTVPSASISWSGTQTLGSPSKLTATINGLTTGTATLAVSGETYTGVSASASTSITITIAFANSISFTTSSAVWGSSGAAQGIFVPVTNSWSSSQQLTIYATLKSGTSTYVLVGGETLAAGQTGTAFLQDFLTTVPAGTYQVTFSALTTANQAVSGPTTPITVIVP